MAPLYLSFISVIMWLQKVI